MKLFLITKLRLHTDMALKPRQNMCLNISLKYLFLDDVNVSILCFQALDLLLLLLFLGDVRDLFLRQPEEKPKEERVKACSSQTLHDEGWSTEAALRWSLFTEQAISPHRLHESTDGGDTARSSPTGWGEAHLDNTQHHSCCCCQVQIKMI